MSLDGIGILFLINTRPDMSTVCPPHIHMAPMGTYANEQDDVGRLITSASVTYKYIAQSNSKD